MQRKIYVTLSKYVILTLIAGLIILPIYWTILSSFKTEGDIFSYPPSFFLKSIIITNYMDLFLKTNFVQSFINTSIISTIYSLLTLFFCSLAGFVFAKYEFPGRDLLFAILLATMLIPIQVIVIPLFIIMANIGWIDSFQALIVPFAANAFGIFLIKQNMLAIPTELIESSKIDGCSNFRIFYKIALPISKPALFTLGLLSFLNSWNDFLWPLIVLDRKSTLSIFISGLVGLHKTYYGQITAASTIATVPVIIIFLFAQKYFIAGAFAGAVKG